MKPLLAMRARLVRSKDDGLVELPVTVTFSTMTFTIMVPAMYMCIYIYIYMGGRVSPLPLYSVAFVPTILKSAWFSPKGNPPNH